MAADFTFWISLKASPGLLENLEESAHFSGHFIQAKVFQESNTVGGIPRTAKSANLDTNMIQLCIQVHGYSIVYL